MLLELYTIDVQNDDCCWQLSRTYCRIHARYIFICVCVCVCVCWFLNAYVLTCTYMYVYVYVSVCVLPCSECLAERVDEPTVAAPWLLTHREVRAFHV
jgi:hypothetical protein